MVFVVEEFQSPVIGRPSAGAAGVPAGDNPRIGPGSKGDAIGHRPGSSPPALKSVSVAVLAFPRMAHPKSSPWNRSGTKKDTRQCGTRPAVRGERNGGRISITALFAPDGSNGFRAATSQEVPGNLTDPGIPDGLCTVSPSNQERPSLQARPPPSTRPYGAAALRGPTAAHPDTAPR